MLHMKDMDTLRMTTMRVAVMVMAMVNEVVYRSNKKTDGSDILGLFVGE